MKKILTIFLLLLPAVVGAQERPTVAVVLSGGGAKGVAHIEALRAVEAAGIPIDIVCGTSIGSLVGAVYCMGYSTDFLDSLVHSLDWTALFSDRTDPATLTLLERQEQNTYAIIRGLSGDRMEQGGLIRGRNLAALFNRLCAPYADSISFDSLPIRFACVATDIVTGNEVDFHSGYLERAMRASMAIPGVFTPVRMGDSILVDGGLSNNYPADLAKRMGADVIIGVSVQDKLLTTSDIGSALTVFEQLINVATNNKYDENVAISDVMMEVNVEGYSAASFSPAAIDTLMRRGAAEADKHRGELLAVKHLIDYAPGEFTRHRQGSPARASNAEIMNPQLHDAVATPAAKREPLPIVSVGFRFDSEEMGALIVNFKAPLRTRLPMGVSATLRLGREMRGTAKLSFFPRSFTSPTIAYHFDLDELNIYKAGRRTYNVKYRRYVADLAPFNFKFRSFTVNAGLRWDYHNYYGNILSSQALIDSIVDQHLFTYHFSADVNTENNWHFPSRGTRLHLGYAYHTDDLLRYNGNLGINEATFRWRLSIPIGSRFALRPSVAFRGVVGDSIPYSLINAVGASVDGHYVEQMMAFPGARSLEFADNYLGIAALGAQYRILNNHYVILQGGVGATTDRLPLTDVNTAIVAVAGGDIGYGYDTPMGPIIVKLGYNTLSKQAFFYFNLGHYF